MALSTRKPVKKPVAPKTTPKAAKIDDSEQVSRMLEIVNKHPKYLVAEATHRVPQKYTPELGKNILELMEEGYSLEAACGILNTYLQRIYEWQEKHPELKRLVRIAKAKRLAHLERKLLAPSSSDKIPSTIFALKCARSEEWQEKSVHEVTGAEGGPIQITEVKSSIVPWTKGQIIEHKPSESTDDSE